MRPVAASKYSQFALYTISVRVNRSLVEWNYHKNLINYISIGPVGALYFEWNYYTIMCYIIINQTDVVWCVCVWVESPGRINFWMLSAETPSELCTGRLRCRILVYTPVWCTWIAIRSEKKHKKNHFQDSIDWISQYKHSRHRSIRCGIISAILDNSGPECIPILCEIFYIVRWWWSWFRSAHWSRFQSRTAKEIIKIFHFHLQVPQNSICLHTPAVFSLPCPWNHRPKYHRFVAKHCSSRSFAKGELN